LRRLAARQCAFTPRRARNGFTKCQPFLLTIYDDEVPTIFDDEVPTIFDDEVPTISDEEMPTIRDDLYLRPRRPKISISRASHRLI